MRLQDVAIWWDDNEEAEIHAKRIGSGRPRIWVFDQHEVRSAETRKYDYLSNSVGRCFAGWDNAPIVMLAAYMLNLYHKVTFLDGVPVAEAHEQFMKIDEYRCYIETRKGPFEDLVWLWGDASLREVEALTKSHDDEEDFS